MSFLQMSTLSQHRAIHSDARPYVCEFCRKTFNRVSTLISHKKTHSDYKPHKCHICGKAFHQKGNLRNHIFTHTNERPYKCDICTKGFNQMSNLMCHKVGYLNINFSENAFIFFINLKFIFLIRLTPILRRACIHVFDAERFSTSGFRCELTKSTSTASSTPAGTSTTRPSKLCHHPPHSRKPIDLFYCRKNLRIVHMPNEDRGNIEHFDKTIKQGALNRCPLQRLKITKTYVTEKGVVTEKVICEKDM